jgi:hypothetical protein
MVFIDKGHANPDGRLQDKTRLSVVSAGEYIAILEVTLQQGLQLPSGIDHLVRLRLIADRELFTGIDYEIRDPLKVIGRLCLIDISVER